jgi:hypothetical protein
MPLPIKVAHPLNGDFFHYHLGPRFDPGAQAEVLNMKFQLPVYLARGPGQLAGSLMVTEHPQVWFNQQTGLNGLGGTQAGRTILQPLLDISQFEGV